MLLEFWSGVTTGAKTDNRTLAEKIFNGTPKRLSVVG
jgi:hypothetical protein